MVNRGKDDDLDCAADIRERYPIDEVWNLMMDADEEFHKAWKRPTGVTVGCVRS